MFVRLNMNKISSKKVTILFAIAYLIIGSVFAYSDISVQKSIFICDPISNVINSPDVFGPDNLDSSKCRQQSWSAEDISTFVTMTVLWLPVILLHR